MANKKINELSSRTPALSDLMIVGDPSSGYSYKCTVTALATIIETDIADGYVTIGTTQTISGAKTFSNNLTLTSVVNTPTDPDKFLTLNASNVVTYRTGAEVLSDIGGQAALSGTGIVKSTGGTISYLTDNSSNWNTAYDNMIVSAAVTGTTTKTLTLTQQDAGTITASWTDINTDAVTSVFGRTGAVVATEGDYTLTQLGDVTITTPSTGQVLKYNGTIWVNDTDANTGTVTSVALSTGTTGTDISVSGSPITSSGTITLNIPTASATNRGALSSTDWTTFNNKQNALTLTTTGTSGAATLVGSTLNIPQYQGVLTNPVTGTGTTNYIPKFTSSSAIGNSDLLTDGSGNLAVAQGNAPTQALNIYRAGSTQTVMSAGNSNTGLNGTFFGVDASGNGIINTTGAFANIFSTNSSERMRLDASGNLGLGTSNPLNLLHISQASANTIFRLGNNSAYDQFIYFNGANDWSLGMDYSNSNAFVLSNASSIGTNDRLVVTTSGNLGLGVTPSAWSVTGKVFEFGGGGGSASLFDNGINDTWYSSNAYYNGTNWIYKSTGTATQYYQGNGGQHKWYTAPSGTAGNAISFTQAMTLDASGRLGIGQTSPQYRLDVYGGARIENAGEASIIFRNNTWGNFTIGQSAYSLGGGFLSIGAASAIMTFDGTNQRVGIGTTSPDAIFHVAKPTSGGVGGQIVIDNPAGTALGNTAELSFLTDAGASGAGTRNARIQAVNENVGNGAANMQFWTWNGSADAERMRITSGGNVGIGSSNPAQRLQVEGNSADIIATLIKNNNTANGNKYIQIGVGGTTGYGITGWANSGVIESAAGTGSNFVLGNYETGPIIFQINDRSEKMRLTSSGELLINTTSDAGDYKLQVNGNVYSTGTIEIKNAIPLLQLTDNSTNAVAFVEGTDNGLNLWADYNNIAASSKINFIIDGSTTRASIDASGNLDLTGSIKTAAPSGGTAKPIKFGEIVTLGGSNTQGVRVEIDGTVYYLVTGYLP